MQYQFFIFAWPGYFEAAARLEIALQQRGCHVTVVASGAPRDNQNWIHLSEDAYFGEQFLECLSRFDGDVLVHIQADAGIPDFDIFLNRLKLGHSHPNIGIWAPDVDYTFYQTRLVRRDFANLDQRNLDPRILPVLNTDCTCWSLAVPVVQALRDLGITESHFGWGWDSVAAAISDDLGLLVIRDSSIKIRHPRGTNYNSQLAEIEFQNLISAVPQQIQETLKEHSATVQERYSRSRQAFLDRVRRLFFKVKKSLRKQDNHLD